MRVTIQTISDLKHQFGTGEVEVDLDGSRVRDLLRHLKQRYDFDLSSREYTMLFVNGRGCVDWDHPLREGDHVAIVPIMAAG